MEAKAILVWVRFIIYGLVGWAAEILWTATSQKIEGKEKDWRLIGHTSVYMFFIYGLLAPLFEPLHDRIRMLPVFVRGLIYVIGFWLIEYISGWLLRQLTGRCPWDYSDARFHLHGLIRFDYAPLWFAFGLFIEYLHDRLVVLTPGIIAVFSH